MPPGFVAQNGSKILAAMLAPDPSREIHGLPSTSPERHAGTSAGQGSVKLNVAPRPSLGVAHKRPPCDSTIERLIARPMPEPCGLVVKKALKIWSVLPAG